MRQLSYPAVREGHPHRGGGESVVQNPQMFEMAHGARYIEGCGAEVGEGDRVRGQKSAQLSAVVVQPTDEPAEVSRCH